MRRTEQVYAAELGFTAEEMAFLQPQATENLKPFMKKLGDDTSVKPKSFYQRVDDVADPEKVFGNDPRARQRVLVLHDLAEPKPARRPKRQRQTELHESGFALSHSSYGAVEVGNPSGNTGMVVGSASVDNFVKALRFKTATISLDSEFEPRLYGSASELMEITLSLEQFCMMIRGNKGVMTPCGITWGLKWADRVPSLTHVQRVKRDVQKELWNAQKPFVRKVRELSDLIKLGASKKADYEALLSAAREAKEAFEGVYGDLVAVATAAGMKEIEVAREQFNFDIAERLGQLKLGHSVDDVVKLLTSGTSVDQR